MTSGYDPRSSMVRKERGQTWQPQRGAQRDQGARAAAPVTYTSHSGKEVGEGARGCELYLQLVPYQKRR
jgi:hypothetical protein